MKNMYFAAILGFQTVRMTSSISLGRPDCARDCPIGQLLKVEALKTVGVLLTASMELNGVIYQMGEHCWKPVLCCPLGYNHDPNVVCCL